MAHVTIIDDQEITFDGKTHKVRIDHLLDSNDEDEQYTGCYRVTLDTGESIKIELNGDAVWAETGKEPTELTRKAGELIEGYEE